MISRWVNLGNSEISTSINQQFLRNFHTNPSIMSQPNSFLGQEQTPDYLPTQDERTLAILSHILTLVAPILAPLIIYLLKKDESKYVAAHAKESLNYQITIFIICFVLVITIIGILLVWLVAI